MKSILAIGELLWDLVPDGRLLGGAPANFAFRLQELGNEAIMVSKVGDDVLGDEAVQILAEAGLDVSYIQKDANHPTGTVDVFFDKDKNPDYHINISVAYDFIMLNQELLDKASNIDCIAYGTLAQRSKKTRDAIRILLRHAKKAIKFCDINLRKECYSQDSVTASLEFADIVKLNHNELRELGEMFHLDGVDDVKAVGELVEKFSLQLALVTYAEFGALAVTDKNEVIYSPGYKVKLEDALGAGDAFSAAFIHKYLLKRSIAEALDAGNLNGAKVAMQKGAMRPLKPQTFRKIFNMGCERVVKESFAGLVDDLDQMYSEEDK